MSRGNKLRETAIDDSVMSHPEIRQILTEVDEACYRSTLGSALVSVSGAALWVVGHYMTPTESQTSTWANLGPVIGDVSVSLSIAATFWSTCKIVQSDHKAAALLMQRDDSVPG